MVRSRFLTEENMDFIGKALFDRVFDVCEFCDLI